MDGLFLVPQDKPPVRCEAVNEGFFHFQRDAVGGASANLVEGAPCIGHKCDGTMFCPGTEGYTDTGYKWLNTSAQACNLMWTPEPP